MRPPIQLSRGLKREPTAQWVRRCGQALVNSTYHILRSTLQHFCIVFSAFLIGTSSTSYSSSLVDRHHQSKDLQIASRSEKRRDCVGLVEGVDTAREGIRQGQESHRYRSSSLGLC